MATVLVVDDREVNRSLMETLLTYAGHTVVQATGGVEALRLVRARRPALVVTDVLMPDMDGYEFVQELRADPTLAGTPVVFCTANYLEAEVRSLAAACGVAHVLFRSGDPARLVAVVEEALGQPVAEKAVMAGPEAARTHARTLNANLLRKVDDLAVREEQLQARAAQLMEANAELTRANEALAIADGVRVEFVRCVSHEVRTPLTNILGYTELLADMVPGYLDEGGAAMVDRVRGSAVRLMAMVNDLLTLSGADAGTLAVGPTGVDLGAVLDRVWKRLAASATAAGVSLVLDAQPGLVAGDRELLDRALGHLVDNAVKFSPDGGNVVVRVVSIDDAVEVSVQDSGLGIDAADQERVFDRFFRGRTAVAREIQGSGLGLAVVRAVADHHRGSARLESVDGVGTVVTMRLARWRG